MIVVFVLLAGCTTAQAPPGQTGGGETFSGSVSAFRSGSDLEITSNRGRTCWGSYRITNRAGTGVGVMNAVAYTFAAIQGPAFGWIIVTWGDPAVFIAIAAACLLCVVTIIPVRR